MFKVQGLKFKVIAFENRKCFPLRVVAITIMLAFISSTIHAREHLLWGFAMDGYPITTEKIKDVELETGLTPDIAVFFLQWPPPENIKNINFPRESLEAIWNRGAVPCLTWEPMYYKDTREIIIPYAHILNGSYDSYIIAFANQAKLWGKPFMIRFAHEMNIRRYHWGTDEKDYGPESPPIYRRMFQHIVSVFRKTGAHNALWVFCPNAESVPNTSYDKTASWNTIKDYYPGDDYIDILGIDGYNWGTTQNKEKHSWDSRWRSFRNIFQTGRDELLFVSPKKNIIVFETATVDQGGNKTLWIKEALETSQKWGLTGIVWFQSNKEQDWRINSTGKNEYINIIRTSISPSHIWIKSISRENR